MAEQETKRDKKKRIRLEKKAIQPPKRHNQRKVNFIVYGGVFFLVALSALSIFSNVTRNLRQPKKQDVIIKQENKAGFDNQANVFLNAYIQAFFNQELDKSNQDKLLPFYGGTLPDMKQSLSFKGQIELKQATLLNVSAFLGCFNVDYKIKGSKNDTWHDETVQFNIPYAQKDGKYYVSDLPYMTNVQTLKADKAKQAKLDKVTTIYDEAWRKKADSFLQAFFKAYTTDDNSLSTISRDVRAVKGYQFKSLDYSYYNSDKAKEQLNAQVQVTFQDKYGNTHSENFTLDLIKKEDIFFVNHLSHGINSMKEMKKEVSK
ncbi:transposase [Bacilli bacterium]|nr:transposase [Bacilli bacterium]